MTAIPELAIDIPLAPWAQNLIAVRSRYKVIYGGRGSGKSWQIARCLLMLGMMIPLKVLCAREFQLSIKDSVHTLLKEQIEKLGLVGWEVTDRAITYKANGSTFIFAGLWQNVAKIQSFEGVNICWVEEAQKVSANSWKVLIPTIRTAPKGWPRSEIWVSLNPEQDDDPTAIRFLQNTPPSTVKIKVNWQDNPWLPTESREEAEYLKATDPEEYFHVWEGGYWTRNDAQIFAGKWGVQPFTVGDGWLGPFDGIDFGFATTPLCIGRQWLDKRTLYVQHAFGGLRIETDAIPALMDEHLSDGKEAIFRADCARPETISQLQRAGYNVLPCSKWQGSVEDGISFMRSLERIVIHPQAKLAAEQIRLYRYATDKHSGEVLRNIVKKHDDWADQCRYAIEPLIQVREEPATAIAVHFPT